MTERRPVVVVTRKLPDAVERALVARFDARLNADDTPLAPAALGAALREADALLPTVSDRITADQIAAPGRRVRIIANFGVGYNNIDTAAARMAGVVVTNTPDVLTDDTADLAMALLLMAARRLGEGERHLRSGGWTGWRPTQLLGTKVTGKTLGVIGFGRIGRALAHRAHDGFGMRIVYYDAVAASAPDVAGVPAERRTTIEEVLAESDFVSLHTPSTPETYHLLDGRRLAVMKRSAVLVNTSRGDVVDERALADALRAGVIAAAGLDVYEREPAVAPELRTLDNVVLSPHLGSATTETRVAMGERAIANLDAFFRGERPRDRVA